MKFDKDALEAPWLKQQVESHLFFGFCARSLPFALIFLFVCTVALIYKLISDNFNLTGLIENIQYLIFIFVGFMILKLPKYHQAALGWWTINATLFFVCLILLVAGGLVGFFRGNPDAIHLTLLGIIWMPGPEFIPKITKKQKYLTIGRVLISIPIAILGYQTGNWH